MKKFTSDADRDPVGWMKPIAAAAALAVMFSVVGGCNLTANQAVTAGIAGGAGAIASTKVSNWPWGVESWQCGPCPKRSPWPSGTGPGIEVHWYTPPADGPINTDPTGRIDSWVRMLDTTLKCETPRWTTVGERQGNFTLTALRPKRLYDFEYQLPHRQEETLSIQMVAFDPAEKWARKFVRHSNLVVNPAFPLGETGHGSVLTDDDINRAAAGDVVEKVVFVANLRAIDQRLDMIEQELRHIRDLETRLAGQLEYWTTKQAARRRNNLYGDAEYGVDTPSVDLMWLQLLIGPEKYHWLRYNEAEDRALLYEEGIARLALPVERLREERGALRAVLAAAKPIHRRSDMMLATMSMTRRYRDAWEEIREVRDTLGDGPVYEWVYPWSYSARPFFSWLKTRFNWGLPQWEIPFSRPLVRTKTHIPEKRQTIGELVLVMRVGPRELYPLKTSSRVVHANSR